MEAYVEPRRSFRIDRGGGGRRIEFKEKGPAAVYADWEKDQIADEVRGNLSRIAAKGEAGRRHRRGCLGRRSARRLRLQRQKDSSRRE